MLIANLTVSLVSFIVNIPLGYIREKTPKFSPAWFFWIHASIPLIIYLRITLEASSLMIPINIFLAVMGQIIGSRYHASKMTLGEREELKQIYDFQLPPVNPPQGVTQDNVLVALLNMGGPKTTDDVKSFLHNLFMDHRILRFPGSPWLQPFFAWLIIKIRLKNVIENYKKIGGGSPILADSMQQTVAVQKELSRRGLNIKTTLSFNYSSPFPKDTIRKMKNAGCEYILPLSLYPHHSQSTTASNIEALKEAASQEYPEAKFLNALSYHLSDGYIDAFLDRIHETLNDGESLDDFYLMFSAHGTPLYFLKEGDIYAFQIAQTIAKITDRLRRQHNWITCYQSAVGPLQWLKPSTEDMIEALGRRGIKKLIVIPISFVTDHIETLEEIDGEYRELAEENGIDDFRVIKAIKDHPKFINALADCVEASLNQYR